MKKILLVVAVALLIFACNERKIQTAKSEPNVEFNQTLANELKRMAEVHYITGYIPQGKYKEFSQLQWESFKDSVVRTHQERLDEILKTYGFPGYDLVGEEGFANFWLMVHDSDHDPEFQQDVLQKMKIEVDKGNAAASAYGMLVDRVNVNTGRPQIYGTQVIYPMNLADSANVNERRKSIGLPPIEEYLK